MKFPSRLLLLLSIVAIAGVAGDAQVKGKRPAITGISHVIVLNSDMAASKHFYGELIGWPASNPLEAGDETHYQVGLRQYIEVKSAPANDPADRLEYIAFETADARALRRYLSQNGVPVPAKVTVEPNGAVTFMVTDPAGYKVEFLQGGKLPQPSASAASTHIIHIGFTVRNQAPEAHFYVDILGFRPYWHGWMKDETHVAGEDDFKSLQVPDGTDWVEFMLAQGRNASPAAGAAAAKVARNPHHFAPGVESVETAYATLLRRGLPPNTKSHPQQGRDGKMQLNLFDPDGTRVEFMNFQPNQAPCCSDFTASQPLPQP